MPDETNSQLEAPLPSQTPAPISAAPPASTLSAPAVPSSPESELSSQQTSGVELTGTSSAKPIQNGASNASGNDGETTNNISSEPATVVSSEVEMEDGESEESEADDSDLNAIEPPSFTDASVKAPYSQETETRYGEFDRLFKQWRETGDPAIRDRLILMNRNLVAFIARKFLDRGEMSEDLMQQGLIGLINALDNFDPTRGTRFATFASPTIMGEIRRYLRDKTWTMRVPRRLQELHVMINQRIESLTQQMDRSPTYAEIARSLNVEVEEVIEALEMPYAMDPMSIDEALPTGRGDSSTTVGDQIGSTDTDLESWNDHAILQTALEKLPLRERQVLQMVYFKEQTQLEVAHHFKISQMNVSRIQRRALARLRELMNSDDI